MLVTKLYKTVKIEDVQQLAVHDLAERHNYFLLLQALQAGLPQRGSVPSGMMLW